MAETEKIEPHRHLHRCQNCGVIWGHGNMMAGDVEAHVCPGCGKQEWRVYSGGPGRVVLNQPQQAQPARSALPMVLALVAVVAIAAIVIMSWDKFKGAAEQK